MFHTGSKIYTKKIFCTSECSTLGQKYTQKRYSVPANVPHWVKNIHKKGILYQRMFQTGSKIYTKKIFCTSECSRLGQKYTQKRYSVLANVPHWVKNIHKKGILYQRMFQTGSKIYTKKIFCTSECSTLGQKYTQKRYPVLANVPHCVRNIHKKGIQYQRMFHTGSEIYTKKVFCTSKYSTLGQKYTQKRYPVIANVPH